ncbi:MULTISPECIES: hypothetical protein [unclassified Mesorhizobium]|uniref:hypothetical protein n=1 Tax=unclassified Mesorhizobium TaxID=325217 RepID=UPI000BB006D2|nr:MULTISPECIES: hypothetical protein [unclassified Mesorhizobium]PBB23914.1 hypothetical protein CK232_24270 [Mesorhizobium sp. WSM4304]PBB72925.1 hypothetical protein CK227_25095 [Mesorhizobium sp. WSM4308]
MFSIHLPLAVKEQFGDRRDGRQAFARVYLDADALQCPVQCEPGSLFFIPRPASLLAGELDLPRGSQRIGPRGDTVVDLFDRTLERWQGPSSISQFAVARICANVVATAASV